MNGAAALLCSCLCDYTNIVVVRCDHTMSGGAGHKRAKMSRGIAKFARPAEKMLERVSETDDDGPAKWRE